MRPRKKINYMLKNSIETLSEENKQIIFQVFGPLEELLKSKNTNKEFVQGVINWLSLFSEQDFE